MIYQPQLLFPVRVAKIVVQTLKKTTDALEDALSIQNMTKSHLSDTETDELLPLHYIALRIRGNIKYSQVLNNCASITKENAAQVVPQSLHAYPGMSSSQW